MEGIFVILDNIAFEDYQRMRKQFTAFLPLFEVALREFVRDCLQSRGLPCGYTPFPIKSSADDILNQTMQIQASLILSQVNERVAQ